MSSFPEKAGEAQCAVRGRIGYLGEWIAGATVTIGDRSTLSRDNGGYDVSGLKPGKYAVCVEPPKGYARISKPVDLRAGQVETLDFTLERTADIEVYVRGPDRKPIRGAVVSGILAGFAVKTGETDDRGFVRFSGVPPGSYFFRASAEGCMGAVRGFRVEEGQEVATVNFDLEKGECGVFGRVSDNTGKPVSAELNLLSAGLVISKLASGNDGCYDFQGLKPGRYQITVTAPQHSSTDWLGSLSEGRKEVNFTLEPVKPIQLDPRLRYERIRRGRPRDPVVWQRGISPPSAGNTEKELPETD